MPRDLDIDRVQDMKGSTQQYAHHVLIRTGRDWRKNKIEEEMEGVTGAPNFAKSLQQLVGKGGKFYNPYHPVLITNCYLPPSTGTSAPLDPNTSSVHVFPANIYVSSIPNTPAAHESFVQRFLSSKTTFATKTELKYQEFEFTKEESSDDTGFPVAESDPSEYLGSMNVHLHYQKSNAPVILICGHKDRDIRCGTLGPILQKEFNRQIRSCIRTAVPKQTRMYSLDYRTAAALSDSPLKHTKVVLTSCVNGHAYAGNVVIYFPPKWIPKNGDDSVGGKGVWYGRVKPDHLSGIIQETLLNGRVIEELLRGVHRPRKWEPREEVVAGA